MEIIPFKRKHFKQVLCIANSTLGNNYLTTNYLNQYLDSNTYLAFVIIKDIEVIGFTALIIISPAQLKEKVLKDKDWFYHFFKKYSNIALRKQTIVHPNYIGRGYGSELVQRSSQAIEALCDVQLSTVWIKRNSNAMSNLLLKNGFERSKTISNYWQQDSLVNKYSCTECGAPPCTCSTEVYIKKKCISVN